MAARLRAGWSADRSGWWKVSLTLLGIAVALFVALAVSGIALSTRYRPGTTEGLRAGGFGGVVDLRNTHRLLSSLLLWVGLGLVVSCSGLAIQRLRRGGDRGPELWMASLPALSLLATGVAAFTGVAIAWDQLALAAVTVGTDLDGIGHAAFGDGVRFVLIDGAEVSQSTYARWAIAHVALVPLVVLGSWVVTARVLARRRLDVETTG